MEIILIIIMLLIGIGLSLIINHLFPFITLPFIQIILGYLIGLTPLGQHIELEHEIIMVLIIAPLLYNEAKMTHTASFYKNIKSILFYAFPMVIITVVLLGYLFNLTLPLVPIAACFALAASLSPTDLVTVASLSKRMHFSEKDKIVLEGEGLINDASGITTFQIAVLALVTGTFSIPQATVSLVYISLGGVFFGVIIEIIKNIIRKLMSLNGIEDKNLFLIFELAVPFIAFVLAEHFGTSGVLAVVTLGLFKAVSIRRNSVFEAKLNDISSSTWTTLTTILNGIVFIYLGDQIPHILHEVNIDSISVFGKYFLIMVMATITLFLIRFVVIYLHKLFSRKNKMKVDFKQIAVMTFSGVKGTITLATVTALPFVLDNGTPFEERSLVIFIAAGVIVLSILTAIIILPRLLDPKVEESTTDLEIDIAKKVVFMLESEKTEENADDINAVIGIYNNRIKNLKMTNNKLNFRQQAKLEKLILDKSLKIEQQQLDDLLEHHDIDEETYKAYEDVLKIFSRRHNKLYALKYIFFSFFSKDNYYRHRINTNDEILSHFTEIKEIFIHNHLLVIEMLKSLEDENNIDFIRAKILEEERVIRLLKGNKMPTLSNITINTEYNHILERGFQYERNIIQSMFEESIVDYSQALSLRQDVNLMEKYYMENNHDNLFFYLINKQKEKESDIVTRT